MSATFSFNGDKSILSVDIFPPIYLNEEDEFVLVLINFETFNAIPNVDKDNNVFHVGGKDIVIPVGAYELTNINEYLQKQLEKLSYHDKHFKCILSLTGNVNTLKCEIQCTHEIDFTVPNSIGPLLGFSNKTKLVPNQWHISPLPVNILKINSIRVLCNIVQGSYDNGIASHLIH